MKSASSGFVNGGHDLTVQNAYIRTRFFSCVAQALPWRQPTDKLMVSSVNSHTNATRIGWHLWEIASRFSPGLPPGWQMKPSLFQGGLRTWWPGSIHQREVFISLSLCLSLSRSLALSLSRSRSLPLSLARALPRALSRSLSLALSMCSGSGGRAISLRLDADAISCCSFRF